MLFLISTKFPILEPFFKIVPGLILAKGGIILSIYHLMGIPVRYIGIGEGAEDFASFVPESYVDALFS